MPQSPEPLLTPTTLLSALGFAVATILSLVGVVYSMFKKTQDDQQGQLDEGADNFTENAVQIAKIQKDIESVRKWVKSIEKELDELGLKAMQDHDLLTGINADHKTFHGSKR